MPKKIVIVLYNTFKLKCVAIHNTSYKTFVWKYTIHPKYCIVMKKMYCNTLYTIRILYFQYYPSLTKANTYKTGVINDPLGQPTVPAGSN